jgi:sugar/nucleoside kinase (ribokinase family)
MSARRPSNTVSLSQERRENQPAERPSEASNTVLLADYDVVCTGGVFLDLTFLGLDRVPRPGEELYAPDLAFSAGGAANTAVGATRLGLRAALVWPLGRDVVGRFVRELLAAEGVDWLGHEVDRTPVTAIAPVDGDRAMFTFRPPAEPAGDELATVSARAVVANVGRKTHVPAGARVYATVGYPESERLAGTFPALDGVRALLLNEPEALRLSGEADVEAAAAALGRRCGPTVAVTLGPRGALEWQDGSIIRADAPAVEVRDATGAGDLFTAAYVWGDLAGLERESRLRLAALYAGLSVSRPTGAGGAPSLDEFDEEARARGLPPVPRPPATKETR